MTCSRLRCGKSNRIGIGGTAGRAVALSFLCGSRCYQLLARCMVDIVAEKKIGQKGCAMGLVVDRV